jgi:hypothetical protein
MIEKSKPVYIQHWSSSGLKLVSIRLARSSVSLRSNAASDGVANSNITIENDQSSQLSNTFPGCDQTIRIPMYRYLGVILMNLDYPKRAALVKYHYSTGLDLYKPKRKDSQETMTPFMLWFKSMKSKITVG